MTKNGAVKGIKLSDLATELNVEFNDLAPIAKKLGIKDPEADAIPEATATNIRIAKAKRDEVIKPQLKGDDSEQEQVNRKLTKEEVKAIANDLGLTQIAVRELDRALHDRECIIAALEGFKEQERKQQRESAYQTGAIVSKLQQLKQRSRELNDQEKALIEEGLSTGNTPIQIAKSMGVDLSSLLSDLESDSGDRALESLDRAEGIQGVLEGKEMEGTANPFVRLAYQRFGKEHS